MNTLPFPTFRPSSLLLSLILLFLRFLTPEAKATTWDEPWQREVLADADSFVRVKFAEGDGEKGRFTLLKRLAGKEVNQEGQVNGFSLLQVQSVHLGDADDDEFRLPFRAGREYYLFLKATDKAGEYKIATPTSGWASSDKGITIATFRHSYHQAKVPDELYEKAMTCCFHAVKGDKPDEQEMREFIRKELSQAPVVMSDQTTEEGFATFFRQHVALEVLYYLGGGSFDVLKPFLECADRHQQISAVRALGKLPKAEAVKHLLEFIAADRQGFAKVVALRALKELDARESLAELKKIRESVEDQQTGFGGNIMDPRVGTHFPSSVHDAFDDLIKEWEKAP